MSSLSAWEQQVLDSIKDGLAGADPELATLLSTFGRDRAGRTYHRLSSRYAVLAWLLVTMVMIGAALGLSRGDSQPACSASWFGAACASAAPAPGPPFAG